MLLYGMIRILIEGPGAPTHVVPAASQPLALLLVLRAFSSGCTALTGIESISNGVPSFRPPETRNAGQTLVVMAVLMGLLFVGSMGLTQLLAVVAVPEETIVSASAQRLLGNGPAYLIVQASTMLILTVAANTSFAGLPRLTAVLAVDGFLPHQMTNLGDRLVFSNGIWTLAIATATLIVVFGGDTHALIPLFAVGVFLAFTLSQIGMVIHWQREREKGWRLKATVNGLGALATMIVVVTIGASKFVQGAWITLVLIPILTVGFLQIRTHYREVARQLSLGGLPPRLELSPSPRMVIPISGVHRGIFDAVNFARSVSRNVTALYIELEPGEGSHVRDKWERWWPDVPLVVVPSPYRSIVGPLLDFLDQTDEQAHDGQLAVVVLPEFVPARWWQGLLHNQTAWLIKAALLYRRRHHGFQRVIVDVPYHLKQ